MVFSRDIYGNKYNVGVSELTWRPSAYGIVIKDEKILLVKENGRYHLPGGGVDLGEDPKDAVIREVREETGVIVRNPQPTDVNTAFFTFGSDDKPPHLVHVQSIMLYYSCEYVESDPSSIKLDVYEQSYGLTAEWVAIDKLDSIIVGTTLDWRPIVAKCD